MTERVVLASSRFELQRCLGKGGFGTVYQAWDRERGHAVAIKVLDKNSGEALRRFKTEFRALSAMAHPNLISLYELVSDGDTWFFTMELLADAVDFVEWVRPGQPRLDRLRDAVRQLAEALQILHGSGRVHRDIKPSNVLVTHRGRVVLLDFGLVAETDSQGVCESESVVGTWQYAAPEQTSGGTVTAAADWYSVGVILYQAMTGELPCVGEFFEMLRCKQSPLTASQLQALSKGPADMAGLCETLLCPTAEARPTGAMVLEAMGSAFDTQPIATRGSLLVGRDAELAALHQGFEEASTRLVTTCVSGLSGMGKTALVTRFLEDLAASDQQAVVLSGRCYEQEETPYKAFDAIVDVLGRWLMSLSGREADAFLPLDIMALTRLFPVLLEAPCISHGRHRVVDGADPVALRRRACTALRELFTRMALRRRLVLFIDDLQWADEESAVLLDTLLAPPDAPPLLLILAWRSEEMRAGTLLWRLLQNPSLTDTLRNVPVAGLSVDDARLLARRLLGDKAAAVEGLIREADGHPYLLTELVVSTQDPQDVDAGLTLEGALARRVARLPDASRRILEVLAVAGRPLHVEDATAAAAASEASALNVLRAQHLIRSVGSAALVATYHDRIRETVAAGLDAATRCRAHLALAEVLESRRPDTEVEALVQHYVEGGDAINAARLAPLAAAQAEAAMAFDRAARLYRLALKLKGDGASGPLRIKLGDALLSAGRGAEAARVYLEAAENAEPLAAIDLTRRSAHEFLCSGHIDEGLAALDGVLHRQGLHLAPTPRAALTGLLFRRAVLTLRGTHFHERAATEVSPAELERVDTCWSAVVGLSMVDTIRAAELQTHHAQLALHCGEPLRVARALAWEVAFCSGFKGSDHLVNSLEATCRALLDRLQNAELSGRCTHTLGLGIFLVGAFGSALQQFEAAIASLEPFAGVAWPVNNSHLFRFISAFYLGRLGVIAAGYEAQLNICREQGDLYHEVSMLARLEWILALMGDRPGHGSQAVAHAMDRWTNQGYHLTHWYRWLGRVEVPIYERDAAAAWSEMEEGWQPYQGSALPFLQICNIVALDLRARAALLSAAATDGVNRQAWLSKADHDAAAVEHEKREFGLTMSSLLRAGVAAGHGDTDAALKWLESAEKHADATDMAMHRAAARFRRGQLLGGPAGQQLQDAACDSMAAENVENPPRFLTMLTPGPW